jgi:hypothetical protein
MLKFLYFSIACSALTWGLCGWASHFLMPVPTLYKTSLIIGIIGGLIITVYPWGRNLTRVFLLAFWPTLVATIFFTINGTFNFSDVSFAELLNFEFSLTWCGAVWVLLVLHKRKSRVFDTLPATTRAWQKKNALVTSHATYTIPVDNLTQPSLTDDLEPIIDGTFVTLEEELERVADVDSGTWVSLDELDAAGIVEKADNVKPATAPEEPEIDTTGFIDLSEELKRWKTEKKSGWDSYKPGE